MRCVYSGSGTPVKGVVAIPRLSIKVTSLKCLDHPEKSEVRNVDFRHILVRPPFDGFF